MGGDIGTCIGCGNVGWGQTCQACGGLVVFGPADEFDGDGDEFEPGRSRWTPDSGGLREYEGCIVHGRDGSFPKSSLMLEQPGVSIWRKGEALYAWALDDINAVEVDDAAGTHSRISATRVILLGGLGFLAPKHSVTAFVTLTTGDETYVIEVPGVAPPAMRGHFHSLWGNEHRVLPAGRAATPSGTRGTSVEERLRTLTRLHTDGIVSDREFETKRAELIALL